MIVCIHVTRKGINNSQYTFKILNNLTKYVTKNDFLKAFMRINCI